MLTIEILLDGLEQQLTAQRSSSKDLGMIHGSLLADRDISLEDNHVYIGNWWNMPDVSNRELTNVWFCCAGAASMDRDFSELCPGCENVFLFDAPLVTLYNKIAGNIIEYKRWHDKVRTVENLDALCKMVSQRIGNPVAVINSFFQKAGEWHGEPAKSELFRTLERGGQLSYNTAHTILETERAQGSSTTILLKDGVCNILDAQLRSEGKVIARVLVECSETFSGQTAAPYLEDCLNVIRPIFLSSTEKKKLSISAVSTLVADIIDQHATREEVLQRMEFIPEQLRDKPFHPVVVKFTWPIHKVPYNYISGQLEQIFPRSSVIAYSDGLIVLTPKKKRNDPINYDRARLTDLLRRFEAYAGIGECTSFFFSIRPLYVQASAATRLGRVFCRDPEERIFRYLDYSHYFDVDLCVENIIKHHQFGNLIYLCHPSLMNVLRYDRNCGTSLFLTLRAYFECNCSATACAKEMDTHRNTINNRIKLIEDLTGEDLSDVYLRQKLLFSFEVLEYVEKYLGLDPIRDVEEDGLLSNLSVIRSFTERQ